MSTNEQETRASTPGAGQTLVFITVAGVFGILSLLLREPLIGYLAFLLFGSIFVFFFSGKRRRLSLVVYLFLAVALLVGWRAYGVLNGEAAAARFGGWPLIGELLSYTAAKAILALVAGVAGGALGIGLPLWLVVFISAEWMLALRQTYGLERKLAMRLLFELALGVSNAFVIVDEGVIKKTQPDGPLAKFGAPVAVVVKPYNAVVLERGARVSRIEGPELLKLEHEEEIEAVIDLRLQSGNFDVEVLTKDNVPLKVKGSVSFRIERWREARDRDDAGDLETQGFTGVISGPYPVYRWTLYRAVYGVTAGKTWQSQTSGMAGGKVGAAIRGFLVDQIFVVDENERLNIEESILKEIIGEAKEAAIEAAHNWGVAVSNVNVTDIKMPDEAQEEFLRRWAQPWRGWRALVEAQAEGTVAAILAMSKSQAMLAEGRTEAEIDKIKTDVERWKIVAAAEGRRLAADYESEIRRIIATSEAEGRRDAAKIDAETVGIVSLGEAQARVLTAELRSVAERIAEMGKAASRWEVAEIDAETAAITAKGRAQARALAAELDSVARRITEMGKAVSRWEVAEIDAETAAITAVGEAQARTLAAELDSVAQRIAEMGKAMSRWEVAEVDAETAAISAVGKARARSLAAELNSLARHIVEVGKTVSRWQVAEREAETRIITARGKAMSKSEAARVEAESRQETTEIRGRATVTKAQAQAAARRIQADADAEAEASLFRQLAQALMEALGAREATEILVEMAKQKIDLDRMQKLLRIVSLSRPTALGTGEIGFRQPDRDQEGEEEEKEPNES